MNCGTWSQTQLKITKSNQQIISLLFSNDLLYVFLIFWMMFLVTDDTSFDLLIIIFFFYFTGFSIPLCSEYPKRYLLLSVLPLKNSHSDSYTVLLLKLGTRQAMLNGSSSAPAVKSNRIILPKEPRKACVFISMPVYWHLSVMRNS